MSQKVKRAKNLVGTSGEKLVVAMGYLSDFYDKFTYI